MSDPERTVWQLARLADVTDPSALDSAGARFLRAVADGVTEWIGDQSDGGPVDVGDAAASIADLAVPIYTSDLWATYVDLAGWQVDVSDLLAGVDIAAAPERLPRATLYLAGEALASALLEVDE